MTVADKQRWLWLPAALLRVTVGLRRQLDAVVMRWCQPRWLPQVGVASTQCPSVPAQSRCQLRGTDLVFEWRDLTNVCALKAQAAL